MSPEKHASIIEKIKKLFALSKSSNPNEAALALERARSLMIQYSIEQSELAVDQIEDIIEIDFAVSSRFNTPSTILSYWIGEAFFVKPLLSKTHTGYHKVDNKIKFIGSKSDLAVATYVFSYVLSLMSEKSEEYYKSIKHTKEKWSPLGAKKVKNDFSIGFIDAVCNKLKQLKADHEVAHKYETETLNALVVVKNDNIKKYVQEKYGKTKATKSKMSYDKNHYGHGHVEGQKTGIFRGVQHNSSPQLAIAGGCYA
jgi:hypothetical protein